MLRSDLVRHFAVGLLGSFVVLAAAGPAAADYLRIATYNVSINNNPSGNVARVGMSTVLQAIGLDSVGGVQRPIDILSVQQIDHGLAGAASIVNILNGLYGPGTYARTTIVGNNDGNTQAVIYNTHTLQLLSQTSISAATVTGAPRDPLRVQFQPLGLGSASSFYLYSDHYQSGTTPGNLGARLAEANAVRADAAALGPGARFILSGDFNTQNSSESGYSALTAAGTGQAIDPLHAPGNWHATSSFATLHSQAALVNQPANANLTGGGMDDRFDFLLTSLSALSGPGMHYEPGTYHVFGNNGTTYNGNVNDPGNTALPLSEYNPAGGQPSRLDVLNALSTASDHLPVVADFFIPEPSTFVLAALGLLVLAAFGRRPR
jgi:hypothetical protein